jgi:hypothetical protein
MAKRGYMINPAAPTSDTIVLPANRYRTALVIQGMVAGNIFVAFGQAAATETGLVTTDGMPPIYLDRERHGDIVCLDVHVKAANANSFLTILVTEEVEL